MGDMGGPAGRSLGCPLTFFVPHSPVSGQCCRSKAPPAALTLVPHLLVLWLRGALSSVPPPPSTPPPFLGVEKPQPEPLPSPRGTLRGTSPLPHSS